MAQNLISYQSVQDVTHILHLLIQRYPEVESDLTRLIRRIEKKFRYRGPEKDKQTILRAVSNSYHTATEISEATQIPYKTVCKRLAELTQAGILRTTKPADPTPQRGGDKKQSCFGWLLDGKNYLCSRANRRSSVVVRFACGFAGPSRGKTSAGVTRTPPPDKF